MKKWSVMVMLVLSMALFVGCGKDTEENLSKTDTVGDAVIISETPQPAKATEEMNQENETAQKEQPQQNQTAEQPAQELVVDPEELQEPEIAPVEINEEVYDENAEKNLQIVFLGDSILDGYRDGTGIAYLTGVGCNAKVFNLAMGGTTAALTTYENANYEEWNSHCLQGVVHAICGKVDPKILDGYRAGEIFGTCDFSQTDYFVIEYGMNDFLAGIPLSDEDAVYNQYTYVGALRIAVMSLQETYPDAQIVLCSPNYAQFWGKDGAFLGDGNMVNNGGGTLAEYYRVCGNVATDMHTLFLNAYEGIGLDTYTADEYLEDGVHLSEKGRRKYAEKLTEIILAYEAEKNN